MLVLWVSTCWILTGILVEWGKNIMYLEMMKNGAPKRLKPKSQTARLMVMSSGGLSFFFFLQHTNKTMPFPSTDRTPPAGKKRTYISRTDLLIYYSDLVFKSYKYIWLREASWQIFLSHGQTFTAIHPQAANWHRWSLMWTKKSERRECSFLQVYWLRLRIRGSCGVWSLCWVNKWAHDVPDLWYHGKRASFAYL